MGFLEMSPSQAAVDGRCSALGRGPASKLSSLLHEVLCFLLGPALRGPSDRDAVLHLCRDRDAGRGSMVSQLTLPDTLCLLTSPLLLPTCSLLFHLLRPKMSQKLGLAPKWYPTGSRVNGQEWYTQFRVSLPIFSDLGSALRKTLPNDAMGSRDMGPSQETTGRCVRERPSLCPVSLRKEEGREAGSPYQTHSSFQVPHRCHCTFSCPKHEFSSQASAFQKNTQPTLHPGQELFLSSSLSTTLLLAYCRKTLRLIGQNL